MAAELELSARKQHTQSFKAVKKTKIAALRPKYFNYRWPKLLLFYGRIYTKFMFDWFPPQKSPQHYTWNDIDVSTAPEYVRWPPVECLTYEANGAVVTGHDLSRQCDSVRCRTVCITNVTESAKWELSLKAVLRTDWMPQLRQTARMLPAPYTTITCRQQYNSFCFAVHSNYTGI